MRGTSTTHLRQYISRDKSYEDIVRGDRMRKELTEKWCRSMTERLSIKLFGAKSNRKWTKSE